MMKFTRPITREIEFGGERLAVTMADQGVSFRPVGSRKQPHEISWAAILCHATGQPLTDNNASPDQVKSALEALRSSPAAAPKPTPEPSHASQPSHEPAHHDGAAPAPVGETPAHSS
jgi:hypothetical protein